jgi:hypothetical protein
MAAIVARLREELQEALWRRSYSLSDPDPFEE